MWSSQPGSAPRVSYEFQRDNKQWVPCPKEIQAHSAFTGALVLTGLELATSRTESERHIDWANWSISAIITIIIITTIIIIICVIMQPIDLPVFCLPMQCASSTDPVTKNRLTTDS